MRNSQAGSYNGSKLGESFFKITLRRQWIQFYLASELLLFKSIFPPLTKGITEIWVRNLNQRNWVILHALIVWFLFQSPIWDSRHILFVTSASNNVKFSESNTKPSVVLKLCRSGTESGKCLDRRHPGKSMYTTLDSILGYKYRIKGHCWTAGKCIEHRIYLWNVSSLHFPCTQIFIIEKHNPKHEFQLMKRLL